MLKLFKLLFKLIILVIVIDLICVFTINRPLFAIKENNTYKGIFYDVYECAEYSVPQIKIKGTKFNCVQRFSQDLITIEKANKEENTRVTVINEDDEDIYRIYYYGLKSATLNWNGEKYDFADAIKNNVIGIDSVIDEMNIHKTFWNIGVTVYRDGGSTMYKSSTYSMLKCNTINGNNDIYIGDKDMEYESGFCDLLN